MDSRDLLDDVLPFVPPLPATMAPIEVGGMVPPITPPTADELAHYRWLIVELLRGVERLIVPLAPPSAVIALDVTRDLFADLVARITPEEVR